MSHPSTSRATVPPLTRLRQLKPTISLFVSYSKNYGSKARWGLTISPLTFFDSLMLTYDTNTRDTVAIPFTNAKPIDVISNEHSNLVKERGK